MRVSRPCRFLCTVSIAVTCNSGTHLVNAFSAPAPKTLATTPVTATVSPTSDPPNNKPPILQDFDHHTETRLPLSPTGYSTWNWRGNSINYLEMGDASKPALLLIHGFGASAYHFRHNIPILARSYHVYAFDLLGFGWSSKPVQDYSAQVWRDQAVDFIQEVIGEKDVTIAGNSLGGYTAMYAASDDRVKNIVKGCVLLNAAGRFRDPEAETENVAEPNPIIKAITAAIKRAVIALSFIYTKQPARIEQVLRNVYPINDDNVDKELVESIQIPSFDPNAAEVFYRVITRTSSTPQAYVDDILEKLECPLLLAWGENDPWIRPAAADRMMALYAGKFGKGCKRVSVAAGHCPHDENPAAVNEAILEFAAEVLTK